VAGAAVLGRLSWLVADVVSVVPETPRVRSIVLDCPSWPGHLAGQHVDVRLTAEDGYQAERSYSLASPPEADRLVLTVERLEDGEVSTYLVDELREGDRLELRGPIGGYFVWETPFGGPLLLLAGGSGIVPLRAMLRHRAAAGSSVPARLLYSARSVEEVIYREELDGMASSGGLDLRLTLTREAPPSWPGYRRRVDEMMLEEVSWPPSKRPLTYICGPTAFVEAAANGLVSLGQDPARILTERFGPTGG
jgi:ferredoxin-NADP reductase